LVRQKYFVGLSKEQKRIYTEMKNDFISFLASDHGGQPHAVVANQAMVKALRLQQIISGFVKTEKGEEIELKENPRLKALEEILEPIVDYEKVIVWACFKHNYKQIAALLKKMKVEFVTLTGDDSAKDKQDAIHEFQNNPKVRVVVANQSAGGIGINLTQASFCIFYSKCFNLGDDMQAEARNYRGGSEIHSKVTRIDLIAKGTIDQLVSEALENKQDLSEKILTLNSQLLLNY
jgi:non-specific serine/threonine protein kinase